jgi:hypothetical protein
MKFSEFSKVIAPSILKIITSFLITAAIGVRFHQYLANRSLWFDEANWAFYIVKTPFIQLLLPSYEYQESPTGFLLITKLMVNIFGNNEYALRLFPFVSSLLIFIPFWLLFRKFGSRVHLVIGLALFAWPDFVVYYSSELRPYMSDALIALALMLYGLSFLSKPLTRARAWRLGVVGAVVLWFSFPSVFILGGIGMSLAGMYCYEKRFQEFRILVKSALLCLLSFCALYWLVLRPIASCSSLQDSYWDVFMPLCPRSREEFMKILNLIQSLIRSPVNIMFVSLGLAAFLSGCVLVCRRNKMLFIMLLMPLVLTMLASGIHRYPFTGRFLFFYVPFVYFFVAEAIAFFLTHARKSFKAIGFGLLVAVLWHQITVFPTLTLVYAKEELVPAFNHIQKNIQRNDMIYLYPGALPAFRYYSPKYKFERFATVVLDGSRDKWETYKPILGAIPRHKRVWIIFSHPFNRETGYPEKQIMNYLSGLGNIEETFEGVGASAYLYIRTKDSF